MGLDVMTELVARMGTYFKPYIPTVLPAVVDRLGKMALFFKLIYHINYTYWIFIIGKKYILHVMHYKFTRRKYIFIIYYILELLILISSQNWPKNLLIENIIKFLLHYIYININNL